jgi:glycerol uptake facilitator-like aquaporin
MYKSFAELIGTAFLVFIILISGTISNKLISTFNPYIIAASISIMLFIIIAVFCRVSGADFNPVVSYIKYLNHSLSFQDLVLYWSVQFIGAYIGLIAANWVIK